MSNLSPDLLTSLLKEVSRSFYLTLRVLPKAVRPQIGLAYLLARTTDTIADTEIIPVQQRLDALILLRDRILDLNQNPINFAAFAEQQNSSAEKATLLRCEESLAVLSSFSLADQALVREVLRTIVSGQVLDLERFSGANEKSIRALTTHADLDDYTYRVAGCVGEFWTKICRNHLFPTAALDEKLLMMEGIRFGKGLQLVNILRDLPKDLRQGRCYIPKAELEKIGLAPADLLSPATEKRFRGLYDRYLDLAKEHLAAGWHYTVSLPRKQQRIRLACAWPVLIGLKTIEKLRKENPLDSTRRIKVSRPEIRSILLRSVLLVPFQNAWERQGVCQGPTFGNKS